MKSLSLGKYQNKWYNIYIPYINIVITKLINPKTENYFCLKQEVLGDSFSWYWVNNTTEGEEWEDFKNHEYLSHCVLRRPNDFNTKRLFPLVSSQYSDMCNIILSEIFEVNNINVNCVLRINFNLTLPISNIPTVPHYDHPFDHKNLIIFFTESGGKTICEKEIYNPEQDDVILFSGLHYHYLPEKSRRVVMIATFI